MRCPRCQHENRAGARFCTKCGASLALACASCGLRHEPGDEFCGGCGAPLASARPPIEPRFSSPQSYTPKHLAEKILTSKGALEGERKQVTVLFADLKGSMELLADRDPEEARRVLDPVLERMMEAVHRYEGTVNQVMGDGIMALFGAPLAHEDHAVRACHAALRMQETIKRCADEVHRTAGVAIHIRVGLNSGEVVVRSIGSDLRMDYTAVGQTTHLAARMEQMAMPGSILISADTLSLAEGYVAVAPLGPRPVKGLEAPIEVYELVGAGAVRSRLHAAADRGLTRFVGREGELDQLRLALERAGSGRGQVVAVVGDPGVGKSRLYWEFVHSHVPDSWLIVESRSASYGKATPLLPVIELLRAYFQIEGRDETHRIREKVTAKLLSLDRQLEPLLPALLWLLDVPVEDHQWQSLDPPQRRQRTLEAVKRLLLRESQAQPLLVLFEDLHWIDSETQALLDSLVEGLPTARLLLLVNYRREYRHSWSSKSYYTQVRIDPLAPSSAETLLGALLGRDGSLEPLKRLLIDRTEGNPFFLEEMVRTLSETRLLAGRRGAYRLTRDLGTIQVPATVQAVLAARIDRLTPEEKRLLQSAAVIGKDVPFSLLQAMADLPEETLRRAITHLQAAELLYETALFPDAEYTFKHALTHEVAYAGLLHDRRRALHARIFATLEGTAGDRVPEQLDALARHAFRGEVWDKALGYLRQAGDKAVARSASREAAACLEQALVAVGHLPANRETQQQAMDIRFSLRHALFPLGEPARIFGHLREAEILAEALGDQRGLGRVFCYLTSCFYATGEHARAIETGGRALAIAEALGDLTLQVDTSLQLGYPSYAMGDYRRAVDFLGKTEASVQGAQVPARLAIYFALFSRAPLVWCLAELGEFTQGMARCEEVIQMAEAADHPYGLVSAYFSAGHLALRRGEFAKAIASLERGLALSREGNFRIWSAPITSSLGYAYALAGRVEEAVPLLEQALEIFGATGMATGIGLFTAYLGEGYLLAGRTQEASECAERAVSLARGIKERGWEAWALRLSAETAWRRDAPDHERARQIYRQAIELAEELGMRPLLAHCQLGLGELNAAMRGWEPARAALETASALFREMGLPASLSRAEAGLAEAAAQLG